MNKKQIERYLIEVKRYQSKERSICPFAIEESFSNKDRCLNKYCGKVFPGWRRRVRGSSNGRHCPCPCYILSIAYVKRRFREWLKE